MFQDFLTGRFCPAACRGRHFGSLGRGPFVFGHKVIEHINAQTEEHEHIYITHHRAGYAQLGQIHDVAGPNLDPDNRADDRDEAQFYVHVAHLAMFGGGHDGFAEDMGQVGADGIGHGKAESIEGRGHHPGAADSEEASQDSHRKTDGDQDEGVKMHAGDGQVNIKHGVVLLSRIIRGARSCGFPCRSS